MRVAFIEPVAHLVDYHTDYHMILPQLLGHDKYLEFFKSAEGHKIIDNGAAEFENYQFEELIHFAQMVDAHEIVIPDAMGNLDKTVTRYRQFKKWVEKNRPVRADGKPFGYMAVVHGASYAELMSCIRVYSFDSFATCLALPRILCKTTNDPFIRFNIMNGKIYTELIEPRFKTNVHALGSSDLPKEVVLLSSTPIRGIDTSFPGVMSMEQRSISYDPYMPRQADYFTGEYLDSFIAENNHERYLEWAGSEFGVPWLNPKEGS